MKIKYKKNGRSVVFTPSNYDEYNNKRQDGGFYEWQNALAVVANTLDGYPRAISVDRALDCMNSTLKSLDDDDPRDWIEKEINHLEQIRLLLGSDTFFVQLDDVLYQDSAFVCAKTEEDACKNYLLSNYEDTIIWIKDDYDDLIFGEDDEEGDDEE